jgi:signal transduction histidine kinase
MRRRVLEVALTAVALAIVVLGLPLAFAVSTIVTTAERAELERLALRAAVAVSPAILAGDRVELPSIEPGVQLGVYDVHGRRISGTGPARLEAAAAPALSGSVEETDVAERLVEAVPVSAREHLVAVVRSASPESAVRTRTLWWWLGLAGLCLLAALCAGLFALRASRRLVVPLVNLASLARQLGEGDFSVRVAPSGVAEIDAAGTSLNRTAERLAAMLERERSFSANASHQLRTPLTQLQLQLESGLGQDADTLREAVTSAMTTADVLSRTIDDVLSVTRDDASAHAFDAEELVEQCRLQWETPLASAGRPLRVDLEQPMQVAASLAATRQILHVLLDNAYRHGRGAVRLQVRGSHGAVAIDVIDEGAAPPISIPSTGGLGLSLADSLARAEGGRLLVDQQGSATRFTLLLPALGS